MHERGEDSQHGDLFGIVKFFLYDSLWDQNSLWSLHLHVGVLMYFPCVPGLEDLVIIDVQVVYDSITGVILKVMSFEALVKQQPKNESQVEAD